MIVNVIYMLKFIFVGFIVLLSIMTSKTLELSIPCIKCKRPFPTYFISHGGPTMIYRDDMLTDTGAFDTLQTIGKEIKDSKPDYLLVLSGHYQSDEPDTIQISINKQNNANYENKLIYDFHGFGKSLYQEQFKSRGLLFISALIYGQLMKNGIKAKIVERGIDHGVWVPFKIMFGDTLDIPLIQVSLPYSDSFDDSFKLGKVLKYFRDTLIWDPENKIDLKGLIICSGTSVHNLRDIQRSLTYPGRVMPYVDSFHNLLNDVFEKSTPLTLLQNFNNLKKDANFKQLLYQAHPTLDHFLPLIVAAGTNDGSCDFETIYKNASFSLGWGIYKFKAPMSTKIQRQETLEYTHKLKVDKSEIIV